MKPAARFDEALARFSLGRPVTVFVLLLTLLVVGTVATRRIPVELIPSGFENPRLIVIVPWQNAPSREVLDKLVLPLEDELGTVRGRDELLSFAAVGVAQVLVTFKQGTDLDVAYREVRDRVERARNHFPEEIDRVFIRKEDTSGLPIHVLGIAVDPAITDPYNLIQQHVVRRLQRLEGVASVDTEGLAEKELLIELDREKTAAAGLDIWSLAQELSTDNFTLASGTVRDSGQKLLLRSVARYASREDLEQRFVAPSVRLRDVGRVAYEEPERQFRVRAMSKPAVAVVVYKEGDANIMQVSQAVNETLESLRQDPRLASLEMLPLFDQGAVIEEALDTLIDSGIVGALIAIGVLFFFLHRVRLTAILAIAIPLSLLIGLTVMYFAGESLNLITLLGLAICVGNLVDCSIVVADNIHRMHAEGLERREACIRGTSEVGLAITLSTLTQIVVFLPVALVEGPAQFFLLRLAIPVSVANLAALVVSMVFIPLCVFITLPARTAAPATAPSRVKRAHEVLLRLLRWSYDVTLGRVNLLYVRLLAWFVERRVDLLLALSGIFLVTILVPMKRVSFGEGQQEERSGFDIAVQMPETMTLEETEAWFLEAEAVIEARRDELDLDGWFVMHRKTRGELRGWFKRPRTNELSPAAATEIVKSALPRQPGMVLTLSDEREGSKATDDSSYLLPIDGEDPEQLDAVKRELETYLAHVPGVLGVRGGNEPPPNELGLVIDRERAQRYGVSPQVIAGVVGTALMGMQLPKHREEGREIPVRVRFREEDRGSLNELSAFLVPAESGEQMALSSVTDAEFLPTPETIIRRNKRVGRTITLELQEGPERETRERLAAVIAGYDLPEGVTFGADAGVQVRNEDLAAMWWALALSIIFVYLMMGFLFESFILPLSIIFTIPLSIIGVWWSHLLLGKDLDFLGLVAIVLLVGVVTNNGIVLIDYVKQLRDRGETRTAALIAATERRFNPIMMTALTTIVGLIPLYFAGANSIGLSYSSFATTLIGGMTTATLLTLLVIPVLYTMFDDLRTAFAAAVERAVARVGRGGGATGEATPEG